ncbi:NADP-dependent oxidoreductase [Actinacidiphila guanduensis]|uniref:NADPH:quinone reductase n=1 Tax=Actinacidiphila guanduensis TaxID=310781 RepID=A0A1H0NQH8_9ACTN|nr:NADP-dependent oxidoreductase [Actinacidiphila guanduensis]SDO94788.1 NADPH:quinone reductase [Actinacidiphila guanduensis]
MRAVTIDTFGPPSVLHLTEAAEPAPGPGQVRVRVHLSGVNPLDAKIRSGVAAKQFPTPLPAVLGSEFAGTVAEVGPGVTGVAVGDRVAGWPDAPVGSYAESVVSSGFVRVPDGLDLAQAAALPVAANTAARVLDELGVAAGETLLIHGASGAVGSIAVQLAVARGVRVIGTAGPASQDRVAGLGATAVEYGEGLADRVRAAAPDGVDAVLDAAGTGDLPVLVELRGSTDRVVTIADPAAASVGVPFSAGGKRDLGAVSEVLESAAAGRITVTVGRVFPLTEAAAAHELIETGHAGGKVLLEVAG